MSPRLQMKDLRLTSVIAPLRRLRWNVKPTTQTQGSGERNNGGGNHNKVTAEIPNPIEPSKQSVANSKEQSKTGGTVIILEFIVNNLCSTAAASMAMLGGACLGWQASIWEVGVGGMHWGDGVAGKAGQKAGSHL